MAKTKDDLIIRQVDYVLERPVRFIIIFILFGSFGVFTLLANVFGLG